jgi:hypothetical protein
VALPLEPQIIDVEHGQDGLNLAPTSRGGDASPDGPIEVGKPTRISIEVGSREVRHIVVMQGSHEQGLDNKTVHAGGRDGEATIVGGTGTERTVEFVPLAPGEISLGIWIDYADGTLGEQVRTIHVTPSPKEMTRFLLLQGPVMMLVLGRTPEEATMWLQPEVEYSTLQYPIYFRNSEDIQLSVEQSATAPVVQVDKYGLVHGLRPGKAVIVGTFGGMKSRVGVTVYSSANVPGWYGHPPPRNPRP